MDDTLNNYEVTDRQAFISFLDLLHKDYLANPDGWENRTLSDFLEALISCTEDMQGYYDNMKQEINVDHPNWQTFADIFKSATMYE